MAKEHLSARPPLDHGPLPVPLIAGTKIPLKIPTIRSLMKNGTTFENAYVAAPVCA